VMRAIRTEQTMMHERVSVERVLPQRRMHNVFVERPLKKTCETEEANTTYHTRQQHDPDAQC
jgi:hypothetical protein